MFYCEFCKFYKNPFFTEHLRTTASVLRYSLKSFQIAAHFRRVIKCIYFIRTLELLQLRTEV